MADQQRSDDGLWSQDGSERQLCSEGGTDDSNDANGPAEEPKGLLSEKYRTGLPRYANKDLLSHYVPELDPDHPRAVTLRIRMAKRSAMLKRQVGAATFVVIANIAILIALVIRYPPDLQGKGDFIFGDCSFVKTLNSSVHAGLNILSTLLLGAGNYCMQVLVAPTREDMDAAHHHVNKKGGEVERRALDVGIPSWKNLRYVGRGKVTVWFLLGALSTLLHFFWNSTVFSSFPLVAIPRAIVASDFRTAGDNWTASDPLGHSDWWKPAAGFGAYSSNKSAIYGLQAQAATFTRLSPAECVRRYVDSLTVTSGVIIVARNISTSNNTGTPGSSLLDGWLSAWDMWTYSQAWVCSPHYQPSLHLCDWATMKGRAETWEINIGVMSDPVVVDYCLSGPVGNNEERCGLHYSVHILAIVCVCTVAEGLLILWAWLQYRRAHASEAGTQERGGAENRDREPSITLGDAVQSFLMRPDKRLLQGDDDDDGDNDSDNGDNGDNGNNGDNGDHGDHGDHGDNDDNDDNDDSRRLYSPTFVNVGEARGGEGEEVEERGEMEEMESRSEKKTVTVTVTEAAIQPSGRPPTRIRWYRAVNTRTWIISMVLFAVGLAVPVYTLQSNVKYMAANGIDMSTAAIWTRGFGMSSSAVYSSLGPLKVDLTGTGTVMTLVANGLIANSPQVMVSFLYLFGNSILTRQLVADELLRCLSLSEKKPLRVSSPRGMQRSSYFLSLPMRYSLPLMAAMVTLHWFISQTLFLVQTSGFSAGPAGERLPMYDYSARGFSVLGVAWSLALGLAIIVALLVHSVVRHWDNIPLGFERLGFDSAALAVLASRRPEGDTDAHLFPIRLGIVRDDSGVDDKEIRSVVSGEAWPGRSEGEGRLAFSTDIYIEEPPEGWRDNQLPFRRKGKTTEKGYWGLIG